MGMVNEVANPVRSLAHAARHARELAAWYSITEVLASAVQQRQKLVEVLDILDRELGMQSGTVGLLSLDGLELMIEMDHNLGEPRRQAVRCQMDAGVIGRVVQSGKPMIVPRISQEPQFLDRTGRRRRPDQGELSSICVPIAIGNEVVGALAVDRVYDENVSLDEEQRVLSINDDGSPG